MIERRAEVVGAGFAGLTVACALAQRGWRVRVHERSNQLRTTGAGIYLYENGLRVLEAVGAYTAAVRGASIAHTREVRDHRNRLISVHHWAGSRVFSVVRQTVINALAAAASSKGVEIVTNSEAAAATPEGELTLADGQCIKADLIVAADGSNSRIRDALNLLAKRKYMVDGCTRLLMERAQQRGILLIPAKLGNIGRAPGGLVYAMQSKRHLHCPNDARQRRCRQNCACAKGHLDTRFSRTRAVD